jgi:hypothetical protein
MKLPCPGYSSESMPPKETLFLAEANLLLSIIKKQNQISFHFVCSEAV